MFAVLSVEGTPVGLSDDLPESITLEFDTESAPTHRCRTCGEELSETPSGYESTSGDTGRCDDGSHDPGPIPLSWCNSAAVHVDESEDSVTVSISVGDPRGAFTFTIRRVPDDVPGDLAGRLIMHTPYAGQPLTHAELTHLYEGTHVVGTHAPTRRLRSAPPAA